MKAIRAIKQRYSCRCCSLFLIIAVVVVATLLPIPSSALTNTPLPTITYNAFEYTQPLKNFSFYADTVNTNQVILGMTLQVAIEDCTQGTRWYLRPGVPLSADPSVIVTLNITSDDGGGGGGGASAPWFLFNATYDWRICSLFVQPINGSISPTISMMLSVLRPLWFYQAVANPVASSTTVSLRLAWTYWIDQRMVVSVGNTQHMIFCLSNSGTELNYGSAVGSCQLWMQDPADPSSIGATLVSLFTPRIEQLVDIVRRQTNSVYVDPVTGLPAGYVALIGLFGGRSQWDNGLTLSYKHFAVANPAGNFPTVIDQNNEWKSVLPAQPFPYCCESTALGSLQDAANGFVQMKSTSEASFTRMVQRKTITKSVTAEYFDPFSPFDNITFPDATQWMVFGFTASIHREDCDGSLRFVVAPAAANSSSNSSEAVMDFTFQDELCSVRITPRIPGGPLPALDFADAIRRVQVIDMHSTSSSGATASVNVSRRFVWGFLLGDGTNWTIGFDPVPHYYACQWGSVDFDSASVACAQMGGGMNEAYLVTPQYAWEQSLLQDIVSLSVNLTLDDVWIGLDTTLGSGIFSNGDLVLGYTNWDVGQPSMAYTPAVLSNINLKWVSESRSAAHSYCCEMTSIPSRNASGVVTVLFTTSTASTSSNGTEGSRRPTAANVTQQTRSFRPFQYVAAEIPDPATLGHVVYGVTVQMRSMDCSMWNGPNSTSYPSLLWATSVLNQLPSGYILCPSATSQGNRCPSANVERYAAQHYKGCAWFVMKTDASGAPVRDWLSVMTLLQLDTVRLPHDPFATSYLKGRFNESLKIGWAFWPQPTSSKWRLDTMSVNIESGEQFLCPTLAGGGMFTTSFNGALVGCRDWMLDAYLVSITSTVEQNLVTLARNMSTFTNASTTTTTSSSNQFVPSAWIGLVRNSSTWVNGDAVIFTKWASGQPTAVGPALLDASGEWYNGQILTSYSNGQSTPVVVLNEAPFCCKRNGWDQFTVGYTGWVTIQALSISQSVTRGSQSHSRSKSTSLSKTQTGSSSSTQSEAANSATKTTTLKGTRSVELASATFTMSLGHTTSVQLTTRHPTLTTSPSVSQHDGSKSVTKTLEETRETLPLSLSVQVPSLSPSVRTLSITKPLPPIARVDLESPMEMRFAASDIRGNDKTRRSIILQTVFTTFVSQEVVSKVSNATYGAYMLSTIRLSLAPSSPSLQTRPGYNDFIASGGQAGFLGVTSFSLSTDATELTITFSQVSGYFPETSELWVLNVHRNATMMTPDQPPLYPFPPFTFRIDPDNSDSSVGVRVVSTILGALSLASPSAVRDMQFLYMMGERKSRCTRALQRQFASEGLRVTSPVYWDSTHLFSLWVGAGAIAAVVIVLHVIVWMVHAIATPMDHHSAGFVHFPSISILVVRYFCVSFAGFSILLVEDSRSNDGVYEQDSLHFVAGVTGLCVLLAISLVVLSWTYVCGLCFAPLFVEHSEKVWQNQSAAMKLIAAQGHWIGRDTSVVHRSFWWVCGEYRTLWFVGLEWGVSWLMAWAAGYDPESSDSCVALFASLGAVFVVFALIVGCWRPYTSVLQTLLSIASLLTLGSLMFASLGQLHAPDGPSASAMLFFRWFLIVVCLLRSFSVVLAGYLVLIDSHLNAAGGREQSGVGALVRRGTASASMRANNGAVAGQHRLSHVNIEHHDDYDDLDFWMEQEGDQPTAHHRGGGSRVQSVRGRPQRDSMDQYAFPLKFEETYSDEPQNQKQQQPYGQAYHDPRRFSMGSMRRFGSMTQKMSSFRGLKIPEVDSDGEDDDSSDDRRGAPSARRGGGAPRNGVPSPPQQPQQQQQQQQRSVSPEDPFDIPTPTNASSSRPRVSFAPAANNNNNARRVSRLESVLGP